MFTLAPSMERTIYLTVTFALRDGLSLVRFRLAGADTDEQLRESVLEIELQRNKRDSLRLHLTREVLNFSLLRKKSSHSDRYVLS